MSILNTKFQYYPSKVFETKSLGEIDLRTLLNSIKEPKSKIRDIFKQIQKATEEGNIELKDKLKSENLYYFTPSVLSDGKGRTYDNILEYNELMVVEFDKIEFASELKEVLFNRVKSIIAAFMSPSGKGCKFIVRIPKPKDALEYKEYYCGLAYYFDKIEGFDVANYNPLLPLFLSWDPNILIRENAKVWKRKGEKINNFKPSSQLQKIKNTENFTEDDKKLVFNIIRKMFSQIVDNGHNQVRSNSLIAGGYAGAGYMNSFEAESLLDECIENTSYLRKGLKGYKKTAKKFLSEGMKSPTYLNKHEKYRN